MHGAGSAAFSVATLTSGQFVGQAELSSIIWLNAWVLATTTMLSLMVPNTNDRNGGQHCDFRRTWFDKAASGAAKLQD